MSVRTVMMEVGESTRSRQMIPPAPGTAEAEADAFVGAPGEFEEKGACFKLQGARVESAAAEFVKFDAETIFFV